MQVHKRFFKFVHSVISNDNRCIQLCGQLVLHGSHSVVCNSLNYVCHLYSFNKMFLDKIKLSDIAGKMHNTYIENVNNSNVNMAEIVCDMMYLREFRHLTELTPDETECMLIYACTELFV
jgi:hypothetical protein